MRLGGAENTQIVMEQCAANQHDLHRRRRRRRKFARTKPNDPAHQNRRNAQRPQPIPRPPQLPFTQVVSASQRVGRSKGAHDRARRGADRHRGDEPQHIFDPGNLRVDHDSRRNRRANDAVKRVGQRIGRVFENREMIGMERADRELHGHLQRHNPDPEPARRHQQRHEQQARGGPYDGQILSVFAQAQACQHRQQIDQGKCGEQHDPPHKSQAHYVVSKIGPALIIGCGRRHSD